MTRVQLMNALMDALHFAKRFGSPIDTIHGERIHGGLITLTMKDGSKFTIGVTKDA